MGSREGLIAYAVVSPRGPGFQLLDSAPPDAGRMLHGDYPYRHCRDVRCKGQKCHTQNNSMENKMSTNTSSRKQSKPTSVTIKSHKTQT